MAGTLETLLHFEGANGSTTITDSTGKHTWSSLSILLRDRFNVDRIVRSPPATIDTSQAKFGSSSLYFSSVNNYVICSDSSSTLALGTGDFTVDFWVRLDGTQPAGGNIVNLVYGDWVVTVTPGGGLNWYSYYDGGNVIAGATVVTTSVWHHIAFTRQGNNHYLFLDGVQQGSTFTASKNYTASTNYPVICQGYQAIGIVGWIDELRIVLGNADWTANFTPPTAPYADPPSPSGPLAVTESKDTAAFAGTSLQAYIMPVTPAAFTLTGIAAGLPRTYVMPASIGAFTTTGVAANLVYTALIFYTMPAAIGAFTFTGIAANLVYQTVTGHILAAAPGAFAFTGIAANTLYGMTLQQTTVGTFTLTGIVAGSVRSYFMPLASGAFTINCPATGGLLAGYMLPSALGTFTLTGNPANLVYSTGSNSYVVSAVPAVFVFTSLNANLVYKPLVNYVLVCGTGQFYFIGLGVGSPGQGLLSSSGLGTPVVTIPFGGAPVIDVTYLGLKAGSPVSEAAPGEGIPVTKVTTGGTPVVYI